MKADGRPKRQRGFRAVGEKEGALIDILKGYIERGWLVRGDSEWASPPLVVPKPGGKWRLVVEFCHLNECTEGD